jgi:hypothetical protein
LPRKVWIERNFGGLKKYAVGERNRMMIVKGRVEDGRII